MRYPTNILQAKSRIGTAARYIGPNAPELHAAHLEYATLRTAHDLGNLRAQHGEFSPEQVALVVAAMTGDAK